MTVKSYPLRVYVSNELVNHSSLLLPVGKLPASQGHKTFVPFCCHMPQALDWLIKKYSCMISKNLSVHILPYPKLGIGVSSILVLLLAYSVRI